MVSTTLGSWRIQWACAGELSALWAGRSVQIQRPADIGSLWLHRCGSHRGVHEEHVTTAWRAPASVALCRARKDRRAARSKEVGNRSLYSGPRRNAGPAVY